MTRIQLVRTVPVDLQEDIAELKNFKLFRGNVITTNSPEYHEARKLWSGLVNSSPGAVMLQCVGVSDVRKAIEFCKKFEVKNPKAPKSTVRSGGHSMSGKSSNVGGCMIDLRLMRSVQVDVAETSAWVEPGAMSGDFYTVLEEYDLVGISGQVSHTGTGGYASGGGYGMHLKYFGYFVHNTIAMEVVTSRGEILGYALCTR